MHTSLLAALITEKKIIIIIGTYIHVQQTISYNMYIVLSVLDVSSESNKKFLLKNDSFEKF